MGPIRVEKKPSTREGMALISKKSLGAHVTFEHEMWVDHEEEQEQEGQEDEEKRLEQIEEKEGDRGRASQTPSRRQRQDREEEEEVGPLTRDGAHAHLAARTTPLTPNSTGTTGRRGKGKSVLRRGTDQASNANERTEKGVDARYVSLATPQRTKEQDSVVRSAGAWGWEDDFSRV